MQIVESIADSDRFTAATAPVSPSSGTTGVLALSGAFRLSLGAVLVAHYASVSAPLRGSYEPGAGATGILDAWVQASQGALSAALALGLALALAPWPRLWTALLLFLHASIGRTHVTEPFAQQVFSVLLLVALVLPVGSNAVMRALGAGREAAPPATASAWTLTAACGLVGSLYCNIGFWQRAGIIPEVPALALLVCAVPAFALSPRRSPARLLGGALQLGLHGYCAFRFGNPLAHLALASTSLLFLREELPALLAAGVSSDTPRLDGWGALAVCYAVIAALYVLAQLLGAPQPAAQLAAVLRDLTGSLHLEFVDLVPVVAPR